MMPDGYPPIVAYERLPGAPDYEAMQHFSQAFLRANQHALSGYTAQWVADPLHHWSRRWEYPWVAERLQVALVPGEAAQLLDAGSGLTFFPHWLATRFPQAVIHCGDCDPAVGRAAGRLTAPAVPQVRYAMQDLAALTYPDAALDVVYCISVLEHCDRPASVVAELVRVLKPGGRLLLTMDIGLDGRSPIPRADAGRLLALLAEHLTPDGDYARLPAECDEARIVTTAYTRRVDPTLLPWRRRLPRGAEWQRLLRHPGLLLRPTFRSLTCVCVGYTRPVRAAG